MSNPVYTGPEQERQETSLGIVHRAYMALDACVRALTVRYDANIGATTVHDAKRAMDALGRLPKVLGEESDRYRAAMANEVLDINVGVLSEQLARVRALHDRWAAMGHTMGYLPTFLAELRALLPDASVGRDKLTPAIRTARLARMLHYLECKRMNIYDGDHWIDTAWAADGKNRGGYHDRAADILRAVAAIDSLSDGALAADITRALAPKPPTEER